MWFQQKQSKTDNGQLDGRQTIKIYRNFVQGQGNPPECQRFAVHIDACRVVDVHEGDFPIPVQSGGWLFFSYPFSISV